MEQGYSREEAREKAGHQVAVPGTSEHQLGLAVDIVDVNYQLLDTNQENTAVQKWLLENSWRYGFILRYPTDQTDVTGIVYEPWHYRYVGKEYAQDIYKKVSAWSSIWSNGESKTLAHAARVEKTMDKHL